MKNDICILIAPTKQALSTCLAYKSLHKHKRKTYQQGRQLPNSQIKFGNILNSLCLLVTSKAKIKATRIIGIPITPSCL